MTQEESKLTEFDLLVKFPANGKMAKLFGENVVTPEEQAAKDAEIVKEAEEKGQKPYQHDRTDGQDRKVPDSGRQVWKWYSLSNPLDVASAREDITIKEEMVLTNVYVTQRPDGKRIITLTYKKAGEPAELTKAKQAVVDYLWTRMYPGGYAWNNDKKPSTINFVGHIDKPNEVTALPMGIRFKGGKPAKFTPKQ